MFFQKSSLSMFLLSILCVFIVYFMHDFIIIIICLTQAKLELIYNRLPWQQGSVWGGGNCVYIVFCRPNT